MSEHADSLILLGETLQCSFIRLFADNWNTTFRVFITSPTVGVIRRLPRPWVSELT